MPGRLKPKAFDPASSEPTANQVIEVLESATVKENPLENMYTVDDFQGIDYQKEPEQQVPCPRPFLEQHPPTPHLDCSTPLGDEVVLAPDLLYASRSRRRSCS